LNNYFVCCCIYNSITALLSVLSENSRNWLLYRQIIGDKIIKDLIHYTHNDLLSKIFGWRWQMQLEIRLLGQFKVQFAGRFIQIPSRPAQSLLAYLVLNAGVAFRREKLAGLLWPDTNEENARGYLRRALWQLRKSFENAEAPWQDYLQIDEITIAFNKNSAYWLDAELISQHQERDDWQPDQLLAAVSSYQEELLPGFYDEWVVVERERLQICYDQKMRLWLNRLVSEHCWDDVLEWGERWITLGYVPEPAYRALMIAHAGIGDLAGASAVYQRLIETLDRELGVSPSDDLIEIYTQLMDGKTPMDVLLPLQVYQWNLYDKPPLPGDPPYKGLAFFDVKDADLFFGRESLVARLVGNLREHNLLAVVGASGSGKSSVVRAGLIPAMKGQKPLFDGSLPPQGSHNWLVRVFTPTSHPLEALITNVCEETGEQQIRLLEELLQNPAILDRIAQDRLKGQGASHLLLVIDQFEEIFTLCREELERIAFIEALLSAVDPSASGSISIILALRADFYGHCGNYPNLSQALARNQEYISVMSTEELRRAIELPALKNSWDFQPGLVDLLLRETHEEPGALPLLSHALLETWLRRSGKTMTLKGYAESGGVRGAIAKTAEKVFFQTLTPAQQILARNIFLRLTELGEETQDTRRRAVIAELIPSPESISAVQEVLEILAEARLVTLSTDTAEVAHEALIREWPILRQWLTEDREGLLLQRHLTEAAEEWKAMDRDTGELFRGARLAQALEWVGSHADSLNPLEQEFLEASNRLENQRAAELEAQRQRELEAAQKLAEAERQRGKEQAKASKRLRRRAFLIAGSGALAIVLAIIALFAWQRAVSQAALNRSLSLAGSAQLANQAGQGDVALALAMEAVNMDQPPPQALVALRKIAVSPGARLILSGHSNEVRTAAISPDNLKMFSGSCADLTEGKCLSGELILWDLNARKELRRWSAHTGWVTSVAFSLDGQFLISGGQDGDVILWDAISGKEIRRLPHQTGAIIALAVTAAVGAGNEALLTASADGTVILWELATGASIQPFDKYTSSLTAMAVASKSPFAVTGYADGSLTLWDLNSAQPVWHHQISADPVAGVAISTDGSFILSTASFSLRYIDSLSGEVVKQNSTGGTPVQVVFSPDGKYALVVYAGVVVQWDVENWHEQKMLTVDIDGLSALAISQDGTLGLSGYANGSLHLWNLVEALEYQTFDTHMMADSLAVSPDGQYLLIGNESTDTQSPVLWDISRAQIMRTFQGFNEEVAPGAVAINPDGNFAAAGGGEESTGLPILMVWNLASGELACRFEGYRAVVRSVAFSPDSRFLLASSEALRPGEINDLILWDVQTCQLVHRFDLNENEDVAGIAFSSDGSLAVTGSAFNKSIILWDVNTGLEIRRFVIPINSGFIPIFDVAFGPNDRTILAPGPGPIYLWDVETGEIIRRYSGHTAFVWSLDISLDGKYILSGSNNGEVILWDFSTGEELYRLNAHTQPVLSVAFSPDGKYAYAVSTDGLLSKWKISVQSLPELLDWIQANRYVRSLTCEERQRYRVEPLCEQGTP
jgi:WD40 repeat protein/DNA-binding SARP family transcriptional activator